MRIFSTLLVLGFSLPASAFSPEIGAEVRVAIAGDGVLEVAIDEGLSEVLDVAVEILPHGGALQITALDPTAAVVGGAEVAAQRGSFRSEVHVLVAVPNEVGDEILAELVTRSYFLCEDGKCEETSHASYMVGVGIATRELDDEGRYIISYPLVALGGGQ